MTHPENDAPPVIKPPSEEQLFFIRENAKLVRAEYLPHVALTGGYMISNPNVFNGFQKKFSGVWNIGVMVQVPVWSWFEGTYKVRAAKAATTMAEMQLSDTREKINLQVTQSRYKVREARKRLDMAIKNIKSAEENLRCAQVGSAKVYSKPPMSWPRRQRGSKRKARRLTPK